ncbi:hypothetical protein LTR78_002535 [Recurvomyces mirabilis]|uniref:Uncharacterized protein n=1 Tax=Recurvomyces mirabilis TaxID=574656 RepID=A0AAE1C4B0_9PEZI|nr:hypothetical protein LTR78_002535 [Recurvomyces mirabilis]KAK5157464.1 hypothetical protein LTS14_004229 [Recurvomyces mirabilis]
MQQQSLREVEPSREAENWHKSRASRPLLLRLLGAALLCILVWWSLVNVVSTSSRLSFKGGSSDNDLVGAHDPPPHPTALIVSEAWASNKWTVSIPHNAGFPLRPKQYADICTESQTLQKKLIAGSRARTLSGLRRQPTYYTVDHTFVDIGDAEQRGFLPSTLDAPDNMCTTSLTFLLDTEDASFGKSLLMLWLSYGLAKKEGRAFFVDDTRWPYGEYTFFFMPPPDQDCSPPPAHYVVPCPHQAKHLVVSAATAPWTFGPLFEREYSRQRYPGIEKQQGIFDLIWTGYEDLFYLNDVDAGYAATHSMKLRAQAKAHGGSVVGMHIRRGDLHPREYQYSRDYLPLERYGNAAKTSFRSLLPSGEHDSNATGGSGDFNALMAYMNSPLVLASDDPDIISTSEFSSAVSPFKAQKAQERIQLATKATLDLSSPKKDLREPGSAYVKHVDENSGWEGGFFSALFYSIGSLDKTKDTGDEQEIPEQALRMRELVGRAYLLDLAVLGESDAVVCAVSSAGCRVLAVMMGWDAVKEGRWVNVDDHRPWTWT